MCVAARADASTNGTAAVQCPAMTTVIETARRKSTAPRSAAGTERRRATGLTARSLRCRRAEPPPRRGLLVTGASREHVVRRARSRHRHRASRERRQRNPVEPFDRASTSRPRSPRAARRARVASRACGALSRSAARSRALPAATARLKSLRVDAPGLVRQGDERERRDRERRESHDAEPRRWT